MELVVNGSVQDGRLTNEAIEAAIRSLASDGDSFAILAKSEMSYLQTSGSPKAGFVLEYQDGSIEEHYSCTAHELSADQVVVAFQRYFAGDNRWRTDMDWVRADLGHAGGPASPRTVLIAVAIVIAALIGWYIHAA